MGRIALGLGPVVLVARAVAFLIPVAIAAWYGVTPRTDAFFFAVAADAFLLVVLLNTFSMALTPVLADIAEREPEGLAGAVGASAALGATAGLLGSALQAGLLGPSLGSWTAFGDEALAWSAAFLWALVPWMTLTGANIALRTALQIRGDFALVAGSPFVRGMVALTVLGVGQPALGPYVLPASFVIAEAAQLVGYLGWLGLHGVPPRLDGSLYARLARSLQSEAAVVGAGVLVAGNVLVDKAFAATLEPGSVSLLEYADRARLIPQTMIESTLIPVVFATWATLAARGDDRQLGQGIDQTLRWVVAWVVPPTAGLFIARLPALTALYERGAFDPSNTPIVADLLGWYLPGLPIVLLGAVAMRGHVVTRRRGLVFGLGVASIGINTALDAALVGPMGLPGVALASTLVWWTVPGATVLLLGPLWTDHASWRSWSGPLAAAAWSVAVAAGFEVAGLSPRSWTDPALYGAAGLLVPVWLVGLRSASRTRVASA